MKNIFLTMFAGIFIFLSYHTSMNVNESEELYKGFENIGSIDSANPENEWLLETLIKFKKDSVFIDQSPIVVSKGDTLSSASDGGFYYFKGIKTEKGNQITIFTKEFACDYCPKEMKINADGKFEKVIREKNYLAERIKNGLKIENQIFKRIENGLLRSED